MSSNERAGDRREPPRPLPRTFITKVFVIYLAVAATAAMAVGASLGWIVSPAARDLHVADGYLASSGYAAAGMLIIFVVMTVAITQIVARQQETTFRFAYEALFIHGMSLRRPAWVRQTPGGDFEFALTGARQARGIDSRRVRSIFTRVDRTIQT